MSPCCFRTDPAESMHAPPWLDEPPLAEMLNDPTLRQLMASDRVSLESLTTLVSCVRQRLAV